MATTPASVLVATVVDRTSNAADAARLEMLGVRAPLPAAAFIATWSSNPALAFARAGVRGVAARPELAPALPLADDAERGAARRRVRALYDVVRDAARRDRASAAASRAAAAGLVVGGARRRARRRGARRAARDVPRRGPTH